MEIIQRGLILPEEEQIKQQLNQLPNNWWCIGGNANRFTFQKSRGLQLDFILICPKGIFLIESKNVSTIDLVNGNKVRFFNSEGKQIRRSSKQNNPIDEIIEIRYQAKDWLTKRKIEDFLTTDKQDLKVFLHGLVVLSNEQKIQYKNCSLESLSYYTHKYPSLIPLSKLNEDFFNQINLPINCKILNPDEMLMLFKLFYNPEMTISQILAELKKEETKFFEEKQIFIEKLKLLEKENIQLNKKSTELEQTRNNLISINQESQNKIKIYNKNKKKFLSQLSIAQTEKNNFLTQTEKNQDTIQELKNSLNQKKKELELNQKEKNDLIKKYELKYNKKEKQKYFHKITKYKIINISLCSFFIIWAIYFFINYKKFNNESDLLINKSFGKIVKAFPKIQQNFKNGNYSKILEFWKNEILNEKDFTLKDYYNHNIVFYYIARAYQNNKSHKKAIKYFDIFTELIKNPELLLKAYLFRSYSYLALKNTLDRVIYDLQKALEINKKHLNDKYQWKKQIIWNLAKTYKIINSEISIEKKEYLKQILQIKDPSKESLKYYDIGKKLSVKNKDLFSEANFSYEIGHMYMNKRQFNLALKNYLHASKLLELLKPNKHIIEKLLLVNYETAIALSEKGNYKQAEEYFNIILALCEDENSLLPYANRINLSAQFHFNMALMFEERQQYKKALIIYKKGFKMANQFSSNKIIENYNIKIKKLNKKLSKN